MKTVHRLDAGELQMLVDRGFSDQRIADFCGVSKSTILRWRSEFGIRAAARDFKRSEFLRVLKEMLAEGCTDKEIAARTGVQPHTVADNRRALGLLRVTVDADGDATAVKRARALAERAAALGWAKGQAARAAR